MLHPHPPPTPTTHLEVICRRRGGGNGISRVYTQDVLKGGGIPRARIFKLLWSQGIDSKELIPPAYVALRAGTMNLFLLGS